MSAKKPLMVACPQCGKSALWSSDNPYRPFCSQRCKLIDLGQWATEKYRLPEQSSDNDESEAPPQ